MDLSYLLFIGSVFFYKYFNVDEIIDVRITSRIISIIMCIGMLYGSGYSLWYDDFTYEWNKVVIIGKTYTLLDFYFVVFNYNKFANMYWQILLHHIILFYIFLNYGSEQKLLASGLFVESSSIFLNIAWFMIKAGWQNSLLFKINSGLLWITYLVFRVIGLPIILYLSETIYSVKIGISFLIFLNWYWFMKISGKFFELLNGDKIKAE